MSVYQVVKDNELNVDQYPQWIREYIDENGLRDLHDYGLKPFLKGITDAADRNKQKIYNELEMSAMLTPTNKPTSKSVSGPTAESVSGPTASDCLMYPGLEECYREKLRNEIVEGAKENVPGRAPTESVSQPIGNGYKLGTFLSLIHI